jgi:hypothetical protein
MKISKQYFGLQIKFCKKLSQITGRDFLEILPLYSDFVNRLWIGREKGDVSEDYQAYHPTKNWKKFQKKFNSKKPVQSTYEYYLAELKKNEIRRKKETPRTSAFRYDIEDNGESMRVHTHMYYRENKYSPLSKHNIKFREAEIKKCLSEVKEKHSKVKYVKGHSWLYNINTYRRLFPKSYLKTAKPVEYTMQGFGLWGQFLDRNGNVKKELSSSFLKKVAKAKTMKDLWKAYPFMALELKAPIKDFYKKYKIE